MKYKTITISIIFIIIGLQLFSQPVSKELAKTVAKNYYKTYAPEELQVLKNKHQARGAQKSGNFYEADRKLKKTYVKRYNNHVSYYVNTFKNGGFVIVSGHKAKGPVLVHSAAGKYDPGNLPPVFVDLMEDYNKIIDVAFQNKARSRRKLEIWKDLENLITTATKG